MKPVFTSEDIRKMDAMAIAQGAQIEGLVGAAGAAVADMVTKAYPACAVLIFCGPGNNGADGLAAAKILAPTHGVTVALLYPDKYKGAALYHRQQLQSARARILEVHERADLQQVKEACPSPHVVVDALLGTGSARAPQGVLADAIDLINDYGAQADVIALDVPTGVVVDSGRVYEKAVRAHHTIALMGYKPCHLLYPAAQYAGRLQLAMPFATTYQAPQQASHFTRDDVQPLSRRRDSHKGSYGCLTIVAGSEGYSGAGEMCARAALRSGCGTLVLASPRSTVQIYRQKLTEAMTLALPEQQGGYGDCSAVAAQALARATACVLGPGMGSGEGVWQMVQAAIASGKPTVLDADALNTLAERGVHALQQAKGPIILTPHPKELARLMHTTVEAVLDDPLTAARTMARENGCVCVLKMASTIIASPERAAFTTTGCAGMAKGGSGDVLAGCIGALLAQHMEPFYAACFGAYVCGLAGQFAQRHWGMTSMLPTDTIVQLPRVFKRFEK